MARVTGISPVPPAVGRLHEIYDAPPGFREFGVTDPDGHDIAFGRRVG